MSKQYLIETLQNIETDKYVWSMYFFKIDRRYSNPYAVYKVRFKNADYLLEYATSLSKMINKYQLSKIDKVSEYTGENTKVSCDKIQIDNELIKEQWDYLVNDVFEASDENVKVKYNGYILEGMLAEETEKSKNIIFVKIANPVINLQNKRSIVFSFDENQELASMTDEVCKLYMDVDFMVINNNLYTFNYRFEELFHVEKTMKKVKNKAIENISLIDAFDDKDKFIELANKYKSPRTFITLNQDRMNRIKSKTSRKEVADMLEMVLDRNGKFMFKDSHEVAKLIKYLCFKIFRDEETRDILEADNVSKFNM